jgi:hypothetical protein
MYLDPTIIGKEFSTDIDPNTTWTVRGYCATGTLLILASTWDQASNRTRINSFKLTEIKFKGKI